jgi:hypothetical protein
MNNLTPEKQIKQIDAELVSDIDLERLTIKYKSLATDQNYTNQDHIYKIINENQKTIEALKKQIVDLSSKITDLGVEYNEKLENMRTKHRKEIYRLHNHFTTKLAKNQNTTT